ncbi:nopaline-binding periplasmic protein [Hypericibacter adhaerens]|jgi:octopine/nopaline transport system substrate-binding protein|uniref:Nopaline-binding periplasmic protein n=1 Tax=Hypericibacter adhaerens TaxID=2602016 RepID=A0A5J6MVR6_9PROT|nr:transporter substrate-binding domain-containing protein [Hypericibacter adhaerens]QEX21391.1 nopaline-binding periplasmic protein [Hypericibacter adhaerens]
MTSATPAPRRRAARPLALAAAMSLAAMSLAALIAGAPASGADMAWKSLRIGMRGPDSPVSEATIGYEADLAQDLCRRMAVACTFDTGKGNDGVAALLARRVDALMSWLPVTASQRQTIDFSYAYALERHGLIVPDPGPLAGLPGTGKTLSLTVTPQDARDAIDALRGRLAGRTVGALAGSVDLAFLQGQIGGSATIRPYESMEPLLRDLAEGRLDAAMAEVTRLQAIVTLSGYRNLAISGPQFSDEELFGDGIAVGVRKPDRTLREMFDRAIADAIGDGTLERLSLKWFKADISPHRCNCKPF